MSLVANAPLMPVTLAPDRNAFNAQVAAGYNQVPVCARLPLGMQTPASLYRVVMEAKSVLLQSSRVSATDGRYSIIGFKPFSTFKAKDGQFSLDGKIFTGNPLLALRDFMAQWRGVRRADMPLFCGGAIGYFGYECNHYIERLPRHPCDDLAIPDMYFLFFDRCIVVDHVRTEILLIASGDDYDRCCDAIDELRRVVAGAQPEGAAPPLVRNAAEIAYGSNMTRAAYIDSILRIQEYIRAGDTYQVNLSQRLHAQTQRAPFDIYRRLTQINPVHFSSYFDLGDFHIVSGSPERLVRVEGRRVFTRPIAGTRRRGTAEEEARFIDELRNSEKEQAEHAMLVDLERNDLGRVCNYGSVRVSSLMEIIKYSHVMHIESEIEGELAAGKSPMEVMTALFPGGTVTGVPKVRTMEIITELEPNARGLYTGSIGYINFSQEMDMNIVIRTILVKGGHAYVQAGGGIVQDAVPEREYKETLYKARAQLEAL